MFRLASNLIKPPLAFVHLHLQSPPRRNSLVKRNPAYSSTLLAFCGGPKVSGVIAEAHSTVELRKLHNANVFVSFDPAQTHARS